MTAEGAVRAARLGAGMLCSLLVVLIGVLDYRSGYTIGFAIFYLIPVGAGSWWVGRGFGAAVAVASTVA